MAASTRFNAGDKVRFKGSYLRDTGQVTGGEGHKRFIVNACACQMCKAGEWVATHDPIAGAFFTPEEIAAEPHLAFRHINAGNLEKCR